MMTLSLPLVLASNSPRRRELLGQLVEQFQVHASDIEERRMAGESPSDYVCRLAQQKAAAVSAQYPDHYLLGSDTIVVYQGNIFEKPVDQQDAVAMLQQLSGHTHQVLTAVAVLKGKQQFSSLVTTNVTFRPLTDAEILAYWQTGEPADKAGAYGIQGLAGQFVEQINGSYSAVVGLPLCQTYQLLQKAIKES